MVIQVVPRAPARYIVGLNNYARLAAVSSMAMAPRANSTMRSISTQSKTTASVSIPVSRSIHSSAKKDNVAAIPPTAEGKVTSPEPLSVLPLSMVLRSLAITSISSSRLLLPPSLFIMNVVANSEFALFNPEKNPLLKSIVKNTFYVQFCAGENKQEIRAGVEGLRSIGFKGVILNYAKEVVLSEEQLKTLSDCVGDGVAEAVEKEINPWKEGCLKTVSMVDRGDFVALKFTGAGRQALYALSEGIMPPPELTAAINEICDLAVQRGVCLLFDAEQVRLQGGIDTWTLEYMRKYNTGPDDAVIFGTYQAYLKRTPAVLQEHLELGAKEGFTVGVKLVRGAYIDSDPREMIHDTKQDTDDCYNALSRSVLRQEWAAPMSGSGKYPKASLVIASHNAESVRIGRKLLAQGQAKSPVAFAQLQGMADDVSCELLVPSKDKESFTTDPKLQPQAFKYVVWGSTGECMKYLLRRAYENRDAVERTADARRAMWKELVRRVRTTIGLA